MCKPFEFCTNGAFMFREHFLGGGGRHMLSKQKTYIIIYIKKLIKYCKHNTPTLEAFECVRKINPGISIFASLAKKIGGHHFWQDMVPIC